MDQRRHHPRGGVGWVAITVDVLITKPQRDPRAIRALTTLEVTQRFGLRAIYLRCQHAAHLWTPMMERE